MRIVITGGLGHLGSRLVKELGDEHELTVIDNFLVQRYPSLFSDNLPKQGVRFVEGDICSYDLKGLFKGQDVVIHLAAITDATGSAIKPADVWWVNYHGTQRVADACMANGCAMVFPSTTSVYGKADGLVDEECTELKPQSPYASSKLTAERHLVSLTGLRYITLRLGTIFGTSRGMRFHTAVNSFCWLASTGKPITVWRTALHQKRPYLCLSDFVSAMRHILSQGLYESCETYNVLTSNYSPNDIVTEIRKHRNDASVRTTDSAVMNQLSYVVSYAKFAQTGWMPRGSLAQGVSETMQLLSGLRGISWLSSDGPS